MEQKVTQHAFVRLPMPSNISRFMRAVDLLVSKGGTLRTDERSMYDALLPAIKARHVVVDGNVISIGENFEQMLMSLAQDEPGFLSIFMEYRKLVSSLVDKYSVVDSNIMSNVSNIVNTDEKIIYLASVLAETAGKVDVIIDKVNAIEALCSEINLSLSVVESITFDENPNS